MPNRRLVARGDLHRSSPATLDRSAPNCAISARCHEPFAPGRPHVPARGGGAPPANTAIRSAIRDSSDALDHAFRGRRGGRVGVTFPRARDWRLRGRTAASDLRAATGGLRGGLRWCATLVGARRRWISGLSAAPAGSPGTALFPIVRHRRAGDVARPELPDRWDRPAPQDETEAVPGLVRVLRRSRPASPWDG